MGDSSHPKRGHHAQWHAETIKLAVKAVLVDGRPKKTVANTFYDQAAATWLRGHQDRAITELEVGELFGIAYGKAATVQNAESGFRKSGIYPFNRDVFTDEDFAAAETTDRPLEVS